jgi:protein-tyrosine phosphatase
MTIDRIPLPRTEGALWLCGRNDVGPDAETVLSWASASTIVCLNSIEELAVRFPEYVEWLRANMGGRAIWYPIQNFRAPSPRSVMPVVRMITDRLERGEGVVMHCAAGQGRAGTMAACLLMALGDTTADAVRTVARHRVFAGPGSASQWALLDGVAALLADGDPGPVHDR